MPLYQKNKYYIAYPHPYGEQKRIILTTLFNPSKQSKAEIAQKPHQIVLSPRLPYELEHGASKWISKLIVLPHLSSCSPLVACQRVALEAYPFRPLGEAGHNPHPFLGVLPFPALVGQVKQEAATEHTCSATANDIIDKRTSK